MDKPTCETNQKVVMENYKQKIIEMKKNGQGLMSLNQYMVVGDALSKICPCDLLVFGLGYDSLIWDSMNKGTTIFIEDDEEWSKKSEFAHLKVVNVMYNTKVSDKVGYDSKLLYLDLGEEIMNKRWDCIIVDAPLGHQPPRPFKGPGRMSSIFMASQLITEKGIVIVDDMGRPIEREYSMYYFGEKNLVNLVEGKLGVFQL